MKIKSAEHFKTVLDFRFLYFGLFLPVGNRMAFLGKICFEKSSSFNPFVVKEGVLVVQLLLWTKRM